jgi:hypothetical protein
MSAEQMSKLTWTKDYKQTDIYIIEKLLVILEKYYQTHDNYNIIKPALKILWLIRDEGDFEWLIFEYGHIDEMLVAVKIKFECLCDWESCFEWEEEKIITSILNNSVEYKKMWGKWEREYKYKVNTIWSNDTIIEEMAEIPSAEFHCECCEENKDKYKWAGLPKLYEDMERTCYECGYGNLDLCICKKCFIDQNEKKDSCYFNLIVRNKLQSDKINLCGYVCDYINEFLYLNY